MRLNLPCKGLNGVDLVVRKTLTKLSDSACI